MAVCLISSVQHPHGFSYSSSSDHMAAAALAARGGMRWFQRTEPITISSSGCND